MYDEHANLQRHGQNGKHDVIEIDSDCEVINEDSEEVIAIDISDAEDSDHLDAEPMDTIASADYTEHVDAPKTPAGSNSASSPYPSATEYSSLAHRLMKPVPDYPVQDSAHFVWEIEDWAAVRKEKKVISNQFECAGFKWNILLFPKGINDSLSLYIEPHPKVDAQGVADPNWYVCAQFALDIWNPAHPESHYPSASSHRFNKNETDWGFSSFISAKDLSNALKVGQAHPILENNKLNITAYVRVIDDSSTGMLWYNFLNYDSKTSTGFVGLNNQGATCYLNSLLQSYYTTKLFKNVVFQIPTDGQSPGGKSNNNKAVALALQRIFYLMEVSNEPVGTLELTASFGWDSSDAFTQHDVQELNRVLMDKLESAMKGSAVEKCLNDIFVGKMKSYIKCVNVPYESSRVEDFWDIQLNVKGFKNLQESFQNYIEIEMLDGENKYQAGEEHGYQDAKKGVVFQSFPPVLHLQLKRFEYDFMVDDLVKIDDLYEFPDKIDLRLYLDEDLDEYVKIQNWNYKLHGVLVHQGSISNGHYYAMIKPEGSKDTWLRFDDDKVWKVTPSQVFTENFGADDLSPAQVRLLTRMEQNEYLIRRATSAYMLVYYRESELPSILPDTIAPIPAHVSEQIQRERDELLRIEQMKTEALHYMHVKIVTANNFTYYDGFDTSPDPSKPKEYDPKIFDSRAYATSVKVRRDATYSSFLELIAQKFGYADEMLDENADLKSFPFTLMTIKQRNNKTNRPEAFVPIELYGETMNEVYSKCFKKRYDEIAFFILEHGKELSQIPASNNSTTVELFVFDKVSESIVSSKLSVDQAPALGLQTLFLKYFDPVTGVVRGLTFANVLKNTVLADLSNNVNKLLGFEPGTPLQFYEEVSRLKIELLDSTQTVEKNELGTGDILAIQVADSDLVPEVKVRSAQEYYKFLLTRLHILVKPCKIKDDEEDSDFVAEDNAEKESSVEANPESKEAQEITLAKEISKSFDMWVSTSYTYTELAECVAAKIGPDVDPAYLRLFVINNHGARFPLSSTMSLSQIFARQVAVSSISQFEYEILTITLKEYENMKAIKIFWLDSIFQSHLLDLLVPKTSTVADLVEKMVHKLDIPESLYGGLLVWASQDNKYADFIKFDRCIDEIGDHCEIYCGYFPAEVEILVSHDMLKRFGGGAEMDSTEIEDPVLRDEFEKAQKYLKLLNIIPVFHFHKSSTYTHSKPFVFAVFPEEPWSETQARLRKKLGLGQQAFDKVRVALVESASREKYLDTEQSDLILLEEMGKFKSHVSLALDHRDRNPRRQNPFDKGISIG